MPTTPSDALNMSLDDLISKNKPERKPKGRGNGRPRGGGRGRGASRGPPERAQTPNKQNQASPAPRGKVSNIGKQAIRKSLPKDSAQKAKTPYSRPAKDNNNNNNISTKTKSPLPDKLFTGALIEIDPLNADILESDIRELCEKYGEVKKVTLQKSNSIKSNDNAVKFQRALVRFRRKEDAKKTVKELDKKKLDETTMHVTLKE